MQQTQEINIISVKRSSQLDRTGFYLIEFHFDINDKEFYHIDYIDPCTFKIVKNSIKPGKYIIGNDRSNLLTELSIKLHINDEDALRLFWRVAHRLSHAINKLPNLQKQIPEFIDILRCALSFGFTLYKMSPEFHFLQTIRTQKGDVELHICTPSINELIDELNYFETDGTVSEAYTYRQLVRLCLGHSDFFISINDTGNGWIIYWYGEDGFELHSRRVDTLKELYEEVMYRKALSPYNH